MHKELVQNSQFILVKLIYIFFISVLTLRIQRLESDVHGKQSQNSNVPNY